MALPAPTEVRRVALLGTGTIGASWAAHFLSRGLQVTAWDPAPDFELKARAFIGRAWPAIEALGIPAAADPERISFVADPVACVAEAQFIQESAPEDSAVKIALFKQIEGAMPADAVLASSTSGLLMSELQASRAGAERYVLGHPFNPPHILPLVEVLGGRDTDPAAVDWAVAFYRAQGKHAIKLDREVIGHVVDRLQVAMYREAVHLVNEGVASAKVVDEAIAYGPGLRWALMGPLLISHLAGGEGGVRHFLRHIGPGIEKWWADLGTPQLSPEVIDRVSKSVEAEAGGRSIAALEAERDRQLIAILKALRTAREGEA